MQLKKVHRVLEFKHEPWIEPYIRMNTEFRNNAKSEFEKNFYKLMNNSVLGKTMEYLRKRVVIKMVRSFETSPFGGQPLVSLQDMRYLEMIWVAYTCTKSSLF